MKPEINNAYRAFTRGSRFPDWHCECSCGPTIILFGIILPCGLSYQSGGYRFLVNYTLPPWFLSEHPTSAFQLRDFFHPNHPSTYTTYPLCRVSANKQQHSKNIYLSFPLEVLFGGSTAYLQTKPVPSFTGWGFQPQKNAGQKGSSSQVGWPIKQT